MSFLAMIVYRLLEIFQLFLIVRAIFSFIVASNERHNNKIISFFYNVTDPAVKKVEEKITSRIDFFRKTPIDLTVLVVFLIIEVVKRFLAIFF